MNFLSIGMILVFLRMIETKKTIFVLEHFRHGSRGVINTHNGNLDFLNETWNVTGELTLSGHRMEYLLGVFMRKKYDYFLPKEYNPNEFLIFSSDFNRTISSALSQLMGFFPPLSEKKLNTHQIKNSVPEWLQKNEKVVSKSQELSSNILPHNFQVVPIHLLDDRLRVFNIDLEYNCPALKALRLQNLKKEKWVKFLRAFNQTFGERLLKIYGITDDPDHFSVYKNADKVCSTVIVDYYDSRNFHLPDIDNEDIFKFCYQYYRFKYSYYYVQDEDEIIPYVTMSKLMRKILNWMNLRIDLDKQNKTDFIENGKPRFVMISGHDTSISTLEDYLNVEFGTTIDYPTFASNQVFELNREEDRYVISLYFNGTFKQDIDFEVFKEKVMRGTWSDEEIANYCNWGYYRSYEILIYTFWGILCTNVVIGFFAVLLYYRGYQVKKKDKLLSYNIDYA